MLDLKFVHIVLIAEAIVVMSGFGVWGLLNDYKLLGTISLAVAILLIPYGAYLRSKIPANVEDSPIDVELLRLAWAGYCTRPT